MNISDIDVKLQNIFQDLGNQDSDNQSPDDKTFDAPNFIFNLLLAYNLPKASIARLKNGNLNLSKQANIGQANEIIWKKKLHFQAITNEGYADQDPHLVISQLSEQAKASKHNPRFIIVTNFKQLLAIDTKTNDSLDLKKITDLPKYYDFFLPWAGMEKAQLPTENIADVKAATNMAKLYDLLSKDNPVNTADEAHVLNVFLSRLLFCFFAEDTAIFNKDQFTYAISSHTNADGSDLHRYLDRLFEVMNTAKNQRGSTLPAYLNAFEYVNGGLFRDAYPAPRFNRSSRDLMLTLGGLNWAAINPDIFGSMIQAVVLPGQRGSLGMHYTSVPNILKVIEPLFLDDLNIAFEEAKFEPKKLNLLLERLSKIKIFDPACGSGNFLIIAYKKLCEFEIKILQQLLELQAIAKQIGAKQSLSNDFAAPQAELIPKAQLTLAQNYQTTLFSRIALAQFYGIEIDDFAHEIAMLSLWLAQHQMNLHFKALFGSANPTLPLQPSGNIVRDNACRVDWELVCPKKERDEIYILGNPPYKGARLQRDVEKSDMDFVFNRYSKYRDLDYISCWFYKAALYIKNANSKVAFVSTNSICQGEQVALLWSILFDLEVNIAFAHTSFKWENNAKSNAGVTVIVVGLQPNTLKNIKKIYTQNLSRTVENINPYLSFGKNIFIQRRSKPLANFTNMPKGNMPYDEGNLILATVEKNILLNEYPYAARFIKKLVGSLEFINGIERWCLWVKDNEVEDASSILPISLRFDKVRKMRLKSADAGANKLASRPYQFREVNETTSQSIVVPSVSSENREYIPMGFIGSDTIITNLAFAIYDAEPWLFSILTSKMHMAWIKAVCGSLETRIRYSSTLGYNTFPFPAISDKQKAELEQSAYRILEARERYTEKTLAQLYDPNKMPADLRAAHHENDLAVERCYRSRPFGSDEERLEYLFKLYEQMIADENAQQNLFVEVKKAKAKSKAK